MIIGIIRCLIALASYTQHSQESGTYCSRKSIAGYDEGDVDDIRIRRDSGDIGSLEFGVWR
jgi:hypothetical protein